MARSLLFNVLFYVTTTLFVVIGSPLLFAPRDWAMAALKVHANFELWLLRTIVGTKIEVRGRENIPHGPCLVASKHQSAWETFALIPIFRDPALMKRELFFIPFHGWFSPVPDDPSTATAARLPHAGQKASMTARDHHLPENAAAARRATRQDRHRAAHDALGVPCRRLPSIQACSGRGGRVLFPGTVEILPIPRVSQGSVPAQPRAAIGAPTRCLWKGGPRTRPRQR
jgi:hypothetical protein